MTEAAHSADCFDEDEAVNEAAERLKVRYVYRFAKRFFDVVFSLLVLIVFSWLFLIIAIAIKIDDPKGPVLFKQKRAAKDGREFQMYKFRSMCVDAESRLDELRVLNEKTGPVFKMKDDPRVDSRIIETNAKRPLSALAFASAFPPKMTVVSTVFPQVNAQIIHPVEMVGVFFVRTGHVIARFSQKLAKQILAFSEGSNSHVRIPSGAAGLMQPASA